MDVILNSFMAALAPLEMLSVKIVAILPAVVAAILLLLVGAFAGHWLRYIVEHVLKMVRVDDHARKIGLSNVITRLGLGSSLVQLVGVVAHATIILAFVIGAAGAVGLSIVSEFLDRVFLFIPRLMGAILVMGGGLFLGDLAGRIVHRAAEANRVRGSGALMKITHGLLVIFSGVAALECLGIDIRMFHDYMQILIAAVGLGFAIAFGVSFGMAGRDTAERWIRDLTPKGLKEEAGHEPRMRVVR